MFELTVLIFLSLREGVKRLDAGTSERTLKRAHKVRCAAHHDGWPNLGVLAHELLERDESDAVRPVSFLLYGWRLAKREKFNDTPLVVSTGLENPASCWSSDESCRVMFRIGLRFMVISLSKCGSKVVLYLYARIIISSY